MNVITQKFKSNNLVDFYFDSLEVFGISTMKESILIHSLRCHIFITVITIKSFTLNITVFYTVFIDYHRIIKVT